MTKIFLLEGNTPVALFEAYSSFSWNRKLYSPSSAEMTINSRLDQAELIEAGLDLGIIDSPSGITLPELVLTVEDIERTATSDGSDNQTVHCVEAGMLHVRRCLPPPYEPPFNDSHIEVNGSVEEFMKEIVDKNAGPGAPSSRRVSGLQIATNLDRGPSRVYRARFQGVSERLEQVGKDSGIGWEVRLEGNDIEFDIIEGVDRSNEVMFDISYDTALEIEKEAMNSDSRNVSYVAGQGQGVDRTVLEISQGSPEGRNRRETFIDARDTEDNDELESRGSEELSSRIQQDRITVEAFPYGPVRYREHYDLGDLVRLRHLPWGVNVVKRIVEVQQEIDPSRGTSQISLVLDKPPATLRQRMQEELEGRGSQRS